MGPTQENKQLNNHEGEMPICLIFDYAFMHSFIHIYEMLMTDHRCCATVQLTVGGRQVSKSNGQPDGGYIMGVSTGLHGGSREGTSRKEYFITM